MKSEPAKYAWDDLVRDGRTPWDGVRNAQARNNLRAMALGDRVLYYHSVDAKQIVGVAEVVGTAHPDPTTADERWVVVDLAPLAPLRQPVTLADVKADRALAGIPLVTQSRLSVMPIAATAFERILALGKTKLPKG